MKEIHRTIIGTFMSFLLVFVPTAPQKVDIFIFFSNFAVKNKKEYDIS